jgi:hypothetical protein
MRCGITSRKILRIMIGVLGLDSWRGLGIFLFTTVYRTALGPTQPLIQWVPGAFSLGVKRLEREADHSPPSSAEVKKAWSSIPTPQYVFMVWCFVKHRDIFNFTLFSNNHITKVYPKVSGLSSWSENCKWYSSLPLGAIVSLFCESV